jgi:hypothetical protein
VITFSRNLACDYFLAGLAPPPPRGGHHAGPCVTLSSFPGHHSASKYTYLLCFPDSMVTNRQSGPLWGEGVRNHPSADFGVDRQSGAGVRNAWNHGSSAVRCVSRSADFGVDRQVGAGVRNAWNHGSPAVRCVPGVHILGSIGNTATHG